MTAYEDVTTEVTLSSGRVVICHRIPPNDLELFEDAHVEPEPPLRQAKAAGGLVEMVPDTDDEDYQEALDAFKTKRQEDLRRMVFDHIELKEEPTPEELEKLASWGIPLTQESIVRHYMTDYFVDWVVIREEVMRISTVTEGEVQRALDRFRHFMGRGASPDTDGNSEEPVPGQEGEGVGPSGA